MGLHAVGTFEFWESGWNNSWELVDEEVKMLLYKWKNFMIFENLE